MGSLPTGRQRQGLSQIYVAVEGGTRIDGGTFELLDVTQGTTTTLGALRGPLDLFVVGLSVFGTEVHEV